jgi:putative endonuclease
MRESYIYILSNRNRTVFYTGVTADLSRRLEQHRSAKGSAFCQKYNVVHLLYYEVFYDITIAIEREKQIKNWKRAWKIDLIKSKNPDMRDLLRNGR